MKNRSEELMEQIDTLFYIYKAIKIHGHPFTKQEHEFYNILDLVCELFGRNPWGNIKTTEDPIADFAYSAATGKGKINLRELLRFLFKSFHIRQKEIAKKSGVAESSISNFLNRKGGMTVDNIEKVINEILK